MRTRSVNFTEKSAAIFRKELKIALVSMDTAKFRYFYKKWTLLGIYEEPLPVSDEVLKISMCKMLYNLQSASTKQKEKAQKWLEERGINTEMI